MDKNTNTRVDYNSIGRQFQSLPQFETLRRIAETVWADKRVQALWVGGSIARHEADSGSDIDLRVAVSHDFLNAWRTNSAHIETILQTVAASKVMTFGESTLYHVLLESGEILDLFIQSDEQDPPQDATIVLGCRNRDFALKLDAAELPEQPEPTRANASDVKQIVTDFWINSQKHAKVLDRNLETIAQIGMGHERNTLMRLWHIDSTGRDIDPTRMTIHGLTRMFKPIHEAHGQKVVEILGQPLRNRHEIERAIEVNRGIVSKLGRKLAVEFEFAYPDKAENAVRSAWQSRMNLR